MQPGSWPAPHSLSNPVTEPSRGPWGAGRGALLGGAASLVPSWDPPERGGLRVPWLPAAVSGLHRPRDRGGMFSFSLFPLGDSLGLVVVGGG